MSQYLEPRPETRSAYPDHVVAAGMTGVVQLHQEQPEAVVWVPDAYGRMVPVSRTQADALLATVPVTQPRDLTPQPVIDPRAQVVLAAGIGTGAAAAGVGWGLGQILAPLAAIASGTGLWALAFVAVLGAAARHAPARTTNHITTTNHLHARWWGNASATTKNGR